MSSLSEKTIQSEQVFRGRLLRLRVDDVQLSNNHQTRREIIEHPGAVAVLALDGQRDAQRVVLVRQFRKAVESDLLEIPAGTLEAGEEPLACAKRELLEETRMIALKWSQILTFYTAPGFCTEKMWLFLAQNVAPGLKRTSPSDEQIEVHVCSRRRILDMLRTGRLQDAKTLVGLLWWLRNASV